MAALAQGAGHLCSKYLMLRKGKQILREKSSLFLCSKKMRCGLIYATSSHRQNGEQACPETLGTAAQCPTKQLL